MCVAPSRSAWLVIIVALACVVGVGGCTGDAKRTDRPGPERPGGVSELASPTPAPGERQFTSLDLFGLLLPAGAVPVWLRQDRKYLLSNQDVARFFPDPTAAERAMAAAGRVEGAAVDYRMPGTPTASERAVAVSSSAAWYGTVAGAQRVMRDPTMELVIHRFGLHTAEISLATIGDESRAFRGYRDGDGPDMAAYLILFRKANVIGAVVVVMAGHSDDTGELVALLAHKQHGYMP
jgi:hypothetical protein